MHIDPLLALASFGIGIVVGLTGMGGGALMTPVLVLFFNVLPLTAVYDDRGTKWPSLSHLLGRGGPRVDRAIRLGERARLPGRLLAARVPPEVAQRRQEKSRQEAAAQRRRISPEVPSPGNRDVRLLPVLRRGGR